MQMCSFVKMVNESIYAEWIMDKILHKNGCDNIFHSANHNKNKSELKFIEQVHRGIKRISIVDLSAQYECSYNCYIRLAVDVIYDFGFSNRDYDVRKMPHSVKH